MQGPYGAVHGPPWQQHRPPAERKDVRWQSWRGSVQQAAAGQLTCREGEDWWRSEGESKEDHICRGNSQIQHEEQLKWQYKTFKDQLWQEGMGSYAGHLNITKKQNTLQVLLCTAAPSCKVTKETRNMCKTANIQKSSVKSKTRCLFLTCTKAAIRTNRDAATSVAVNTSTRPQVRLAENLLEFRELAIDYRKYIFSL